MARSFIKALTLGCVLLSFVTPHARALVLQDDFTGGLNLPWMFLDDVGNIPPDFTDVVVNDGDQDVKLIGQAAAYEDNSDLSLSTTGYVGLGDDAYFFSNEVHVTATFRQFENITLGLDDTVESNNDMFVVARGDGLTGYILAIDTQNAEVDLVRVDEGVVVELGDDAILRDVRGIDQEGTYTLSLSAIDNVLTGQVFDEDMDLLGEVSIEEDTYESGWAGFGTAINDGGEELGRTLIATSVDDFLASDTLDINVDPPTIDELTAAINAGLTESRFDIDGNGSVDSADRTAWVTTTANTYFGDANLDGEFNSGDFVVVFTAGEYEDTIAGNSLWAEGDWNGDGDFDSGDFVLAFSGGGYEIGPRAAQSVPEPTSVGLALIGLLALVARSRRSQ